MKRFLVLLVTGALAGSLLAGWLGRPIIVWNWSTPLPNPAACDKPVEAALRSLAMAQMITAAVSGLVFGVAGSLIARALRMRAERKAGASGTSGPAAAPPKPQA
jgi:hypothetical protein